MWSTYQGIKCYMSADKDSGGASSRSCLPEVSFGMHKMERCSNQRLVRAIEWARIFRQSTMARPSGAFAMDKISR
jgi:hypothetical protein